MKHQGQNQAENDSSGKKTNEGSERGKRRDESWDNKLIYRIIVGGTALGLLIILWHILFPSLGWMSDEQLNKVYLFFTTGLFGGFVTRALRPRPFK